MTDRAVSVSVDYSMTLIIATLIIGGLLMAAGGLMESQAQLAKQDELEVIGQHVADDLMGADKLVTVAEADGGPIEVAVTSRSPARAGGSSYLVAVDGTNETITLWTVDEDVEVQVLFDAQHVKADNMTVTGGTFEIRYDGSGLVVSEP